MKREPTGGARRIPSVRLIDNDIEIYVDPTHSLFQQAEVSLEEQVSFEAASYLYSYYQSLASNPEHSISNIASLILGKQWANKFGSSDIDNELSELFVSIKQKLVDSVSDEGVLGAHHGHDSRAHHRPVVGV